MNCTASESILLRAQDGALSDSERAALDGHLDGCAACRKFQGVLSKVTSTVQAEAASVKLPDVEAAWSDLHSQLTASPVRSTQRPRTVPLVWFAAPMAAAVALAIVVFTPRQETAFSNDTLVTHVDYVESGDPTASTMVYVDQDSGWLVVWASSQKAVGSG